MKNTVLVFAAHPDDEVLGCGGTMARHSKEGDAVHVVILAEGITSRGELRDRARDSIELTRLYEDAHKANEILSVCELKIHDFPDNRMDSPDLLDIVKVIEGHVSRLKPSIVYTHHGGDLNIDHRRIHDAVVVACRPQPRHPVKRLLFFEVASNTEWQTVGAHSPFTPNWFVDVSDTLDLKLQALGSYRGEIREWPHPRSIRAVESLCRWRGASVGVDAAEAFQLGRFICNGPGE